jgi:hypothetical protein
VGNGLKTSFWKSIWIGNLSLSVQFPVLFDLAYDKDIRACTVVFNVEALKVFKGVICKKNLRVVSP